MCSCYSKQYKLTTDYFSGVLFSCKTLCTGSRLFIEGVAALEWVFEESLVNNEVQLLTETVVETAILHSLSAIILPALYCSGSQVPLCSFLRPRPLLL